MAKEKVTLRMEEGELALLKVKYNTDNQSEAIRLAISECLLNEDKEKIKTLFSYIGKKPPRIGKEVAEIFRQSGCSLFVDLFCGSIAMLCYLPWDKIVSEIGDVRRFSSASKLAQFAAIAPLKMSSANSETTKKRKEGNRRLQATIYFLAIQMIQVSSKKTARNPAFRNYYVKRCKQGKAPKQVLICISRRLINIIYGMLKNQTEYRMPEVEYLEEDLETEGQ